jgi:hypothetical protein
MASVSIGPSFGEYGEKLLSESLRQKGAIHFLFGEVLLRNSRDT